MASVKRIALTVFWLFLALPVRADQVRDFMIAAPENGTDAMLDLILPGAQATLEHRVPIYGILNQLTLRANALYTVPFYESQADVELRILVLTLGGSYGFRHDFHSLTFDRGEPIHRHYRRLRDIDGKAGTDTWGYGEGRATVSLPINDYVLFNAINSMRFQNHEERSFDWRNGVIHDGTLFKSDIMLFLKHRDWGGIAPMMQVLDFAYDDRRYTQFNYGFMAVTRPGFRRRDDIFLVQLLFHPGSTFGGVNNVDSYGTHLLFAPITLTIAYRMVLPVWRPE